MHPTHHENFFNYVLNLSFICFYVSFHISTENLQLHSMCLKSSISSIQLSHKFVPTRLHMCCSFLVYISLCNILYWDALKAVSLINFLGFVYSSKLVDMHQLIWIHHNITINNTFSCQCSIVLLFWMTRLRLSQEGIKNHQYISWYIYHGLCVCVCGGKILTNKYNVFRCLMWVKTWNLNLPFVCWWTSVPSPDRPSCGPVDVW